MSDKKTTHDILASAQYAFQTGNFIEAAQLIQVVIRDKGPSPSYLGFLGQAQISAGNCLDAIPNLHSSIAGLPTNFDLIASLTYAYYQTKNWIGVLDAYHKINLKVIKPLRAIKLMLMAGVALHSIGKRKESRLQFEGCFKRIVDDGLLGADKITQETLNLAISSAIGAEDIARVRSLMIIKHQDFFTEDSEIKVSPLKEIDAWCYKENIRIIEYDSESQIKLDALQPSNQLEYKADAFWAVSIPNVEIIVGWDFVLTSDGDVLQGANYAPISTPYPFLPHYYVAELDVVAHPWLSDVAYIHDDVLLLNCPESYHFGHWIVDFLPRLMAWDRKHKLVIPSSLPKKHRETLTRFGVTADDLVECELTKRYRFRSLKVVQNGLYLNPNPKRVHFVYNALCDNRLPLSPNTSGRNIFLMRGIGTRGVANHDEFVVLLKEYNFEIVDVAPLSIDEQNKLFSGARTVMGVFGSDLLAVYHMRPETNVIELIWDEKEDPVIIRTCAILGMRHRFVHCDVAEQAQKKRRKIDRDLIVDCARLRQVLESISS